jgi:hypothetical protein
MESSRDGTGANDASAATGERCAELARCCAELTNECTELRVVEEDVCVLLLVAVGRKGGTGLWL